MTEKKVRKLHADAMKLAQKAKVAEQTNDHALAQRLTHLADTLEAQAADLILANEAMKEKIATREQLDAFIAGLEKLTEETGIIINGCGCCDSPFLCVKGDKDGQYQADIDEVKGYAGFVHWVPAGTPWGIDVED